MLHVLTHSFPTRRSSDLLRETEAKIHALLTRDDSEEIDRHALALVRGEDAEPVEGLQSLNARAADLRREIAAYRRAMTIQRAVLADLRADLSVGAAEEVRPDHRAPVATMPIGRASGGDRVGQYV